jgi:hypothetical protein
VPKLWVRRAPNDRCPLCYHYSTDIVRGIERFVCQRLKKFTDGSSIRDVSIVFETDDREEPQRVQGDKCGPKLQHWKPR